MKFLDGIFDNKNIMPLNIYYDRGSYGSKNDDIIDIIYKDMDTGKKHVQTIKNPKYEVWITKPEHRNYEHIRNWISKDKCYPVYVHYKTRYLEMAKHLGVPADEVKYSPYIFGFDHQIENFYLVHFILEYGNDKYKKISTGYLDIENDTIRVPGFSDVPGECPVNMVTYIDGDKRNSYTLVLKQDDIPDVDENHKNYHFFNELREGFWKQFDEFENNLDGMVQLCHETFDENFGNFEYNILIFDKEIDLLKSLFQIIRACDNDYVEIWNLPYDISNLFERPRVLGYDPNKIIVDERFGDRVIQFEEDRNPNAHKRRHKCISYTLPTFVDEMVIYAGTRAGRGKLPSLKLNSIARAELKDEKFDFSEEGDWKYFAYRNFKKFFLYNIKDVLLLLGINEKTKDIQTFYGTIYESCVLPNNVYTSTQLISESLRHYLHKYKEGYVVGSNKSRLYGKVGSVDYGGMVNAAFNNLSEENEYDMDDLFDDDDDSDDDDDDDDKFDGAFVMSTEHMSSTGFKLLGKLAQFIHEMVVDFDITSEYPTAILIMNASNETMVGKVFLENPEDIKVEIYPEFRFVGKEEAKYNLDVGNFLTETYSTNDVLNFGEIFLNLPSMDKIIESLEATL